MNPRLNEFINVMKEVAPALNIPFEVSVSEKDEYENESYLFFELDGIRFSVGFEDNNFDLYIWSTTLGGRVNPPEDIEERIIYTPNVYVCATNALHKYMSIIIDHAMTGYIESRMEKVVFQKH